jgi:hypothetical protein
MQATETDDGVVDLNVGGTHYSTTLATLCRYPDSMLAAMFSGRHELKKRAADGRVFIDRDGKAFGYVLQFFRDGDLDVENLARGLRDRLKREACFYCLSALEDRLTPGHEDPVSVCLLFYPTHRANQYVTVGEHPRDLAKDAGSFSAPNVWSALAVLVGMYQGAGYRLISAANTDARKQQRLLFTKI